MSDKQTTPQNILELLRVAKCPNCDGSGATVSSRWNGEEMDGEVHECQWCDERKTLLETPIPDVTEAVTQTLAEKMCPKCLKHSSFIEGTCSWCGFYSESETPFVKQNMKVCGKCGARQDPGRMISAQTPALEVKESLTPFLELWTFFAGEHNLHLTNTQLHDIVDSVKRYLAALEVKEPASEVAHVQWNESDYTPLDWQRDVTELLRMYLRWNPWLLERFEPPYPGVKNSVLKT